MFRLLVFISLAGAASSAAQPVIATAQYDNSRTGANLLETKLTPLNVNAAHFGRLFSLRVDGDVNAQPLYVPNVDIPAKGVHNVVFVATEHDSVYAFDAESQAAEPLWVVRFAHPDAGVNPVNSHALSCSFVSPETGITPTPVIDPVARTIYLVVRTEERSADGTERYYQRLHALDIATGQEKPGTPVLIRAATKGSAYWGLGEREVTFNALLENPRAALLLSGGKVYIAWGSSCDEGSYYGWVMAYDARTLQQAGIFNTAPDSGAAAIWQSGTGLAADRGGSVFAVTGNGKFNGSDTGGRNYGDSVLKLGFRNSLLAVRDFFTPPNQFRLNRADNDLGSTGPVLLPDQAGAHPHLLLAGGKEGIIYLIDRDRMGKYQSPSGAVQTIQMPGPLYGAPAYWNGHVYYFATGDVLKDFVVTNGQLSRVPVHQGSERFRNPGAIPAISANGDKNGIVWVVLTKSYDEHDVDAILQAYDASNLRLLYSTAATKDGPGLALRMTIPVAANGRVYVASRNAVFVYGLRN